MYRRVRFILVLMNQDELLRLQSVGLRLNFLPTVFNGRYVFCVGEDMPVNRIYSVLWDIFQPLLFGLIGAEIDISRIEGKTIGLGIAVLVIGLTLRVVASFLAVFGTGQGVRVCVVCVCVCVWCGGVCVQMYVRVCVSFSILT